MQSMVTEVCVFWNSFHNHAVVTTWVMFRQRFFEWMKHCILLYRRGTCFQGSRCIYSIILSYNESCCRSSGPLYAPLLLFMVELLFVVECGNKLRRLTNCSLVVQRILLPKSFSGCLWLLCFGHMRTGVPLQVVESLHVSNFLPAGFKFWFEFSLSVCGAQRFLSLFLLQWLCKSQCASHDPPTGSATVLNSPHCQALFLRTSTTSTNSFKKQKIF